MTEDRTKYLAEKVEELEDELDEKREELHEASQSKRLKEAKEKVSGMRGEIQDLNSDRRKLRRELEKQIALVEDEAYTCKRCGEIEQYENGHSKKRYEHDNLCESCWNEDLAERHYNKIEEAILGAEVIEFELNEKQTRVNRDMSVGSEIYGSIETVALDVSDRNLGSDEIVIVDGYNSINVLGSKEFDE